jgi:hypothetical protein
MPIFPESPVSAMRKCLFFQKRLFPQCGNAHFSKKYFE